MMVGSRILEAADPLHQAERLLSDQSGPEWAETALQLAELDLLDGRWRGALNRGEEASLIAQQAEDLDLSARAMDLCARTLAALGRESEAARLHEEATGVRRAWEATSGLNFQENTPLQGAVREAISTARQLAEGGERAKAIVKLKEAERRLPKSGVRGLILSLLIARSIIGDSSVAKRLSDLIEELAASLPMELKGSFRGREDISRVTA